MKKYQFFDTVKINTLEELKKAFKTLAFKYHPDKGGDTEAFKILNNEYTELFEVYKNKSTNKKEKEENVNTFKDIINNFINFKNITIEIVGYYVWISGKGTFDTEVREMLDNTGFWYSGKNKVFMYNGEPKKRNLRTKKSKGEIKEKYGCTVVKTGGDNDNNKPPKKLK